MCSAHIDKEEQIEELKALSHAKFIKNPLDPLLHRLSQDFIDNVDLSERLTAIFKVCLLEPTSLSWLLQFSTCAGQFKFFCPFDPETSFV